METKPNIEDLKPEDIVLPPKTKPTKKRFTSRDQIIARIDKFTAKAKRQREQQCAAYMEAGTCRRLAVAPDDQGLLPKAKQKDALGDKLGRKADRLEKDVLPSLKRKLAEFDTETIPGIIADRSVPV